MPVKNNANIGFEKQIWDAACVLRGHIPAAEYRKVIIGLIWMVRRKAKTCSAERMNTALRSLLPMRVKRAESFILLQVLSKLL